MKAVLLYEYGGPEKLRYVDTDVPDYGDNEVLVRVRATSINPVDWKLRSGGAAVADGAARNRQAATPYRDRSAAIVHGDGAEGKVAAPVDRKDVKRRRRTVTSDDSHSRLPDDSPGR